MTQNSPKILCPNICETLKGIILSLTEANVQFTSKLCVLGSIHIVADGKEMASCLLNETREKTPKNSHARRSETVSDNHHRSPWSSSKRGRSSHSSVVTESEDENSHSGRASRSPRVELSASSDEATIKTEPEDDDFKPLVIEETERKRKRQSDTVGFVLDGSSLELVDPTSSDGIFGVEATRQRNSHPAASDGVGNNELAALSWQDSRPVFPPQSGFPWPAMQVNEATVRSLETTSAQHTCTICHGKFTSEEWLQEHAKMCVLRCPCGETYKSQQEYAEHCQTVHNRATFTCPTCSSIFRSRDGLKCHINTAHNRSKIYPCGVCQEGFYTRQAAYVHRRKMHPNP